MKPFRSFAVVAWREMRRSWLWCPAALLLGVLSTLPLLAPSLLGGDTETARDVAALVAGVIFAVVATVVLGSELLAGEIAGRRLGFYLARPIPAAGLWLGKLAGALAVIATGAVLVLLPSLLLGARPFEALEVLGRGGLHYPRPAWVAVWRDWIHDPKVFHGGWEFIREENLLLRGDVFSDPLAFATPAGLLGAMLLVLALAHASSVAFRLKNLLTLVDVAAASVAGLLLVSATLRFEEAGALKGRVDAYFLFAASVILGVLLAGWAQVRWGGTDARRSHAVSSAVLWGVLSISALGLELTSRQVADMAFDSSAPLLDFDRLTDVTPAPRGPWTVVAAYDQETGAFPVFAVDTDGDQVLHLGSRFDFQARPLFSADGSKLYWTHCTPVPRPKRRHCVVKWLDLDASEPAAVTVPRPLDPRRIRNLVLDAEGRRIAGANGRRVWIKELPEGRVVTRFELPPAGDRAFAVPFFDGAGTPRVIRSVVEGPSEIYRLDIATGEAELVAELEAHLLDLAAAGDSPGEPRIWLRGDDSRLLLADAEGRIVGHRQKASPIRTWNRLLSSGSFVRFERSPDESSLHLVVAKPGEATPEVEKPSAPTAGVEMAEMVETTLELTLTLSSYMAGEIRPGLLLLAIAPESNSYALDHWPRGWQTAVLDVDRGEVVRRLEDFAPLPMRRGPGEPGADWLLDERGFPHRLDPATGHLAPVFGGGA